MWVTPAARDWKDTPGMKRVRSDGRSRVDQLARQVYARDNLGGGDGTLNPAWVEWLMGFPAGWLDSVPSATPSSRSARTSSGGT